MDRLIEVFRRLAIVIVWLFGLGISAILILGAQENGALAGLALGALILTWLTTKIVNWILARAPQ